MLARSNGAFFAPESGGKEQSSDSRVIMDANLIGIDMAHFLLKQNGSVEKQVPVKVKSDAAAMAAKETSHRISFGNLQEGKKP